MAVVHINPLAMRCAIEHYISDEFQVKRAAVSLVVCATAHHVGAAVNCSGLQEHGKLWQLKDRHREALTQAGLTRWHMGEIASRIGQIYYEYYTRTSDSRFLKEASVWYDTVRKRQYFKMEEPSEAQLQQQLRYCMRFTLVCILLQDSAKVRCCNTGVVSMQGLLCSSGNS